jgi:proton-dependent oligopeptide transporter, POT family
VSTMPEAQQTKPGFFKQLSSFPSAFWVSNVIELVERFSFYGVRAISALYIVEATEKGGLGFDNTDKGIFFGTWSLIQCILPMFTGGFSDRYGYRISLIVAYAINIVGYGLMAFTHSWGGFMLACCLIGTGTAIFKPPLHGTLAHCVSETNSSLGWGTFYMVVNIGGFVGPIVAGILRRLEWRYAFAASASIIVVNVLVTSLFLKDYSQGKRAAKEGKSSKGPVETFVESMSTLLKDGKFVVFLAIFSGFWFMFMQLFDQLSVFIEQWVDSNDVATFFAKTTGLEFFKNMAKDGGQFNPEWIVNVDAGAIVLTVLLISYFTGFLRHIISMIVGMFIACAGLIVAGSMTTGWFCIIGILVFAVGEMMCSPKFSEYIGLMAPPEKKALYMGYSNIPFAVGWAGANFIGGPVYQRLSDKIALAQHYMVSQLGKDAAAVAQMTRGKVMPALCEATGMSERAATQMLWSTYHPQVFFYLCIGVGLLSTFAMVAYHFWLEADKKRRLKAA